MIKAVLLVGSAVVAMGACAGRNEYKVVDAHGWPVSTWDARGADYLVLRCPTQLVELPRVDGEQRPGDVVLVTNGITRDIVLDARERRAYDDRYCAHGQELGIAEVNEPRTVTIAIPRGRLPHNRPGDVVSPVASTSVAEGSSSASTSSVSAPSAMFAVHVSATPVR